MSDSSTPPPPGSKKEKWRVIKETAGLVAAVGALITAIGSYHRPETGARMSYDELSKGMEQLSKDAQQNHNDITALHGYIDGIVKASGMPLPPAVDAGAPVPLPQGGGAKPPASAVVFHPASSVSTIPTATGLAPAPSALVNLLQQAQKAPPAPAPVKGYTPPSYKAVTGREDL